MLSFEEEGEVKKSHIIRIPCVDGISIVDNKDLIIVKGTRVDVKQASGEKSMASQSTVLLKGACPTIIIKPHKEKVKSLKTMSWKYGGSTSNVKEDEDVVADIK